MKKLSIVLPIYGNKLATIAAISADCILRQETEYDFELIVSNNGGDPTIRNIFESTKFKNRIRYIEPPTVLSMPEHFEWASLHATGKYLMALPARRVLKQGALQKYITVMEQHPECNGCCSHFEEYLDQTGHLVASKTYPSSRIVSSNEIIKRFEKGEYQEFTEMYTTIPTAMNGIVRREFVDSLRLKYDKPYFSTISPDITSAFFHLFNSQQVFLISEPLFLTTNIQLSNGRLSIRSYNHYAKTLPGNSATYKFLPSFLEGNLYASVWEDFLRMKNQTQAIQGVKFENLKPNAFFTYLILHEELIKLVNHLTTKGSFARYKKVKTYFALSGYQPKHEWRILTKDMVVRTKARLPMSFKKFYKNKFSKHQQFPNIYEAGGFKNSIMD